ncbi:MAG TPA: DUF4129 domain-containing protein [Abditibacterium sp.]
MIKTLSALVLGNAGVWPALQKMQARCLRFQTSIALCFSLFCWQNAAFSQTKTPQLSAGAFRAQLQRELRQIEAMEKRRPRPLGPILKRLDTTISVRRDDGQIQTFGGNAFSNLSRELNKPKDAARSEVIKARQIARAQLGALDEWISQPRYVPVDATKIVKDLEASAQIRSGPLWWQKALADARSAVTGAWDSFTKWLNSLLPTPPTSNLPSAPSDKWLWILFYAFVAAILGLVIWFTWRTFGGSFGRRTAKREAILEGEDAELLLLPPDELRARAENFAAQGNFREALRHRFLAMLLQLDARGVWRYDARRTNWEHIAALRRGENKNELLAPLGALTRRFDRVRYGGAPCDEESWREFDRDARDFEIQAETQQKVEVAR